MWYPASTDESDLRTALRELLTRPFARDELVRVWAGDEEECPHPARIYQELGARRLLAPHWPIRYGGLGRSEYTSAVVAEELPLHGIPDSVRVNTVDNAGNVILRAGTEKQCAEYLPGIAKGETIFSVLYTEPDVGSDLGAMSTRADATPTGWLVNGTKVWNARTSLAQYGTVAARTGNGGRRSTFAEVGLFIVPLEAPGVHIERIDSINHEHLFRVRLEDVALPCEALLGRPGQGWSLLTEALGLERAGVNFAGKARRWFDQLATALRARGQLADAGRRHNLRRLDTEIRSARLLSWYAVRDVALGRPNPASSAGAKWWTSELAQRVALLAWQLLGPAATRPHDDAYFPDLAHAVREAPGLTLAAGTSEILKATVATDLLDGGDPWKDV
ncbi:acyl-CoA dehydrogenase [Streptomyces sp. V2]|uniref:acyl-CoA dehydrogenase family protein n=1 Tax=Streptomyces TaxID=1883 RepID=UPI00099E5903|nr:MULTISPECIES: acyl-CoA dehydrogenase family protein [Streptomyces]PWG13317.1 acyl-CoA dehydrogenase [Streptomyces sp. V2]